MNFRRFINFNLRSPFHLLIFLSALIGGLMLVNAFSLFALADGVRLPGEDASAKMESAATLLRFIDTGLFKWSARILAGLCIFSAGWSLKEMRFGPAVISLVAAILFGTAPTWVKNIFSISGSDSVFAKVDSQLLSPNSQEETYHA